MTSQDTCEHGMIVPHERIIAHSNPTRFIRLWFLNAIVLFFSAHVAVYSLASQDLLAEVSQFPENYEARIGSREKIFADLDSVPDAGSLIVIQRKEKTRVLYKVEKTPDTFIHLFINESHGEFGLENAGNVSVKRDRKTGTLVSMTILLRDDPLCYARVVAAGVKSLLSIHFFGTLVYRDLVIPEKLAKLAFESFRSVITSTGDLVEWDAILGKNPSRDYSKIVYMIDEIRKKMPLIDDVDDGAMDTSGRFTFIANGMPQETTRGFNCSGFAKWVIDGFYFPLAGSLTDVARLKVKALSFRGNSWTERYENERDPFFGLDWTRNLALALEEARTKKKQSDPEVFDVRRADYSEYKEDIGFPVSALELTLYFLARKYPGSFYLGSVNGDYGKNPVLRQHFHVIVLLPFFDDKGNLRVCVVERNKETSIGSLGERFGGMFVHLVRIDSDGEFRLQL